MYTCLFTYIFFTVSVSSLDEKCLAFNFQPTSASNTGSGGECYLHQLVTVPDGNPKTTCYVHGEQLWFVDMLITKLVTALSCANNVVHQLFNWLYWTYWGRLLSSWHYITHREYKEIRKIGNCNMLIGIFCRQFLYILHPSISFIYLSMLVRSAYSTHPHWY